MNDPLRLLPPALAVCLLLALAAVGSVDAHHRYADIYSESEQITIEGHVSQWVYREPHTFLHVVARTSVNGTERWIVEGPGAAEWRRRGVTQQTVKPGDHVRISGSPGRITAERRLRLKAIVRPNDGWRWPEN